MNKKKNSDIHPAHGPREKVNSEKSLESNMITREKNRAIAGSYQVVFEACVRTLESFQPSLELQSLMGTRRGLRIQASQARAGTIVAAAGEAWRVEIRVSREATGECQVSLKLCTSSQRADPFGIMYRWIDTFFEALEDMVRAILSRSRGS